MVNYASILALVGLASGLHIEFKRYADSQCGPQHYIRKAVEMNPGHCKQFDRDEIGFHSFFFHVTDDRDFYENPRNICTLQVYDGDNCVGNSHVMNDIYGQEDVCEELPTDFEGRSVHLQCDVKPNPPPKPISTKAAATPVGKPAMKIMTTVTMTRSDSAPLPVETVVQVSEHKHHHVECHECDDHETEVPDVSRE